MSKLYSDKVISKLQNYLNSNDSVDEFVFNPHINVFVDIINVKFIDNETGATGGAIHARHHKKDNAEE